MTTSTQTSGVLNHLVLSAVDKLPEIVLRAFQQVQRRSKCKAKKLVVGAAMLTIRLKWPDLVLANMQKNLATSNIGVNDQAAGGNAVQDRRTQIDSYERYTRDMP
ncbi:hypothetical protein NA56DRAFT_705038 [Hyaloscypha hepaticicola]|uniref:Uncharacterized protein n=1 Tax=Hyaloscypha hepaticicola TaxID=2082293 RepID=A0A2J6Q0T7_9HELO|nr:hypothetical protein NA56DRAFT_705038 [Hyaloscypha hepaticicola]